MKLIKIKNLIKEAILKLQEQEKLEPNKGIALPSKAICPYWNEATELGHNNGTKAQMEIVFNVWQDPTTMGYPDPEYFYDMICAENHPIQGPGVCQSYADGTLGFISQVAYCACCDNFPNIFYTGYTGGTATPNKKLFKKPLKEQINPQSEACQDNLFLIIESDIYMGSFSFDVIELINYMETGDSGNYDTYFSISIGGAGFGGLNLPNVLGVNTEEYGISNLNDLLSIVVSQNNLSIGDVPDIGLGDADSEIYWSELPGGNASELSMSQVMEFVNSCLGEEEEEEEETDLDILCADVWGPYGNAMVTGCNDPLALNYDPCVNASCNMSLTDTSCCEYPSCEDLATQPEHLGCCAKCDSPGFNPEEDPTCAPHCECCGDNYMRYTCSSQGICLSGPNPDYPFETLEECENSGCGEPGGVTDYTGPVFPTMGGTPNTGTPIKDPGKAPFMDKPRRAPSNKVINRLKELAGIKKFKK